MQELNKNNPVETKYSERLTKKVWPKKHCHKRPKPAFETIPEEPEKEQDQERQPEPKSACCNLL